ncbi:MAG: GIY-YIG nuclease family protein [Aequorivita sp.]
MYYVYVLYSVKFDRMYVGMTIDWEGRLKEHNSGKTQSTKPFIPWLIIHTEHYLTRSEAREREKYLKSAAGRRWRKQHIQWPRGLPD